MGQILTKTVFLPKVSHIQINYTFLFFWRNFGKNSPRTSLFSQKMTISEGSSEILRKCVFLNMFEKGESCVKLRFIYTNLFYKTSIRVQILTKTVFLDKVSHIQLKYAFLLFGSIFGEIHRELLFLVQKVSISERSIEIHRKFVFLNMFEKGKSWLKLGYV